MMYPTVEQRCGNSIQSDSPLVDASVDSIISGYENKLGKNIATKILEAIKKGTQPLFSEEELLYLNKRDSENKKEDPYAEVEVITPIPNITIKKGKTELNIGHAATLIKKMEEKFPIGVSKEKAEDITRQVMTQEGEQKQITRNQFLKSVNFPVKNVSEEIKNSVWSDGAMETSKEEIRQEQKSHSKNAYEIRESILDKAMTIVNMTFNPKVSSDTKTFVDEVLNVASRLYEFVENKHRK